LWLSPGKFVLPSSSWVLIVSTGLALWQLERIRVERDPALCEHLNRDVGNIVALDIYFPRHICVLHVLEH
jgi:hypothetical protein